MCQYSTAPSGPQIGALTPYHVTTLGHYALKGAALVFIEATVFFMGCELWKWGKRVFFRHRAKKMGYTVEDLERMAFSEFEQSSDGEKSVGK